MTPREAAHACLTAVVADGAYANIAMPKILASAGLQGRDAAFAVDLAYGALRMSGWYDAVVAAAAKRAADGLDEPVLLALRLGAHQALAMDVPRHAAVSETVDLARRVGAHRAAGFVNAVMRRVVEKTPDEWRDQLAPGDGIEKVALRHSHPEWVARELDRALAADGRSGALEALLEADNMPPQVSMAALPVPGAPTRDEVAASDDRLAAHPLSPVGLVLDGGAPRGIQGVRDGSVRVQDAGSQLAALALTRSSEPAAGEAWLDMCAGPGGKTALLGAEAARAGARVDALELHEHRARLVDQAVAAIPEGTVTVHTGDAREWRGGPYQRILLDAPCTGMGALRRRPEARWRRTEADLADLQRLQTELLDAAAGLLAPGGTLAYVTCSPLLGETREVVAAAAEQHGLEALDARAALATVSGRAATTWGDHWAVQLWTDRDGTDSMFVALLRRAA